MPEYRESDLDTLCFRVAVSVALALCSFFWYEFRRKHAASREVGVTSDMTQGAKEILDRNREPYKHVDDQGAPYQEVREFFASLSVRDFDDIFHTDLIPRVLRKNSRFPVPPIRYLQASIFLVGIVLNVSNVSSQFGRSIPKQRDLINRLKVGQVASDYHECQASSGTQFGRERCDASHGDVTNVCLLILVWAEGLAIIGTFVVSLLLLSRLRWARTDITSTDNSKRWVSVSSGFAWLESLPTQSAMKVLPRLKALPLETMNKYKLLKEQLLQDDGVYSTGDKFYAAGFLVLVFVRAIVLGFAGIFALYLKISSLTFLNQLPLGKWGISYWMAFLGFANQIAGLVPFASLKKEALLFFVFTGENAQMELHEQYAMDKFNALLCKHLFKISGMAHGIVFALTISSQDLQKILITEHVHKNGAQSTPAAR